MTNTASRLACATILTLSLLLSATAQAELQIVYQTVDLETDFDGVSAWRYDYTVAGHAFSAGEAFEIYFPITLYSELEPVAAPQGWSTFVLVSNVPGDFDDSGFAALADEGDSSLALSFSVEFGWRGKGEPGAQRFDLFDADFNTLASGTTVASTQPAIPESSPGILLLAGLGLLWLRASRAMHRVGNG